MKYKKRERCVCTCTQKKQIIQNEYKKEIKWKYNNTTKYKKNKLYKMNTKKK